MRDVVKHAGDDLFGTLACDDALGVLIVAIAQIADAAHGAIQQIHLRGRI